MSTGWKGNEGTRDSASYCVWLQALHKQENNIYSTNDLVWHVCKEVIK